MNKYFYIIGTLILIVALGIAYNTLLVADNDQPFESGVVRNITITARQNRWQFEPEFIEVDQGDRIVLTIINEDKYDHGFAIDAFGISQRMPANETIRVEFIATQSGDFPYYCSVSCGAGEVDGVDRGHFDQIGKLHVRSIVSETSSYGTTTEDNQSPSPETPVESAPRPATEPAETSTSSPPSTSPSTEDPESAPLSEAQTAEMITTATAKARELGYDPALLRVVFDQANIRWNAYHTALNNILKNDPAFGFLEEANFTTVYFTASANQDAVYLWIFIDKQTGEVLHYHE